MYKEFAEKQKQRIQEKKKNQRILTMKTMAPVLICMGIGFVIGRKSVRIPSPSFPVTLARLNDELYVLTMNDGKRWYSKGQISIGNTT